MTPDGPIAIAGDCELDLEAGKVLSGILAVEGCLDGIECRDPDATGALRLLREEGRHHASHRADVRSPRVALAQHLENVRARMVDYLDTMVDGSAPTVAEAARARLGSASAGFDFAAVDAGRCLRDIFRFAAGLANDVYARLPGAGSIAIATRPDVVCTERTETLSLATHYDGDAPGDRRARVHLSLPRERLSAEDFFGLPAKVLHEVFVHAPQAWDAPAPRRVIGSDCALGEGFVDAACVEMAAGVYEGDGLPATMVPFARRFSREAARLAGERARVSADAPFAAYHAAQSRSFGRDVFDDVRRALGGGDGAREQSIALAAALNTLAMTKEQRRSHLRSIGNGLSGSGRRRFATMEALTAFCATRDPAALRAVLFAAN